MTTALHSRVPTPLVRAGINKLGEARHHGIAFRLRRDRKRVRFMRRDSMERFSDSRRDRKGVRFSC